MWHRYREKVPHLLSEKIGRIQSPKIIRVGGGVARETGDVLKQLGLSKPLIVTDKNLVELGHVDLVLNILDTTISLTVFLIWWSKTQLINVST